MKHHVAVYLEDNELTEFRREASRRRISLSRLLKERLAGAETPALQPSLTTTPGEGKTLEKAIGAAVLRELKPFVDQLNLLTAMLDQFALSVLINLPEISEAQKAQAIAAGRRRHQGWRDAVAELMQESLPQYSPDGVEAS